MCGIVGVLTKSPEAALNKIMKDMLFFDTIRGEDSTGLVRVASDGAVETHKRALPAADFMCTKVGNRMLSALNSHVLIGHNRAATIGAVTDANAHPFSHGTVHGVHNGTLRSRYQLEEHIKFTVDSDNLYYHIATKGVEDAMLKADGAFALVWYDSKDNTVHFIRNEERPLYLAGSEDNKHLFFASEPWMFKVAASRHNIKLGATQDLKPGVELIFDMTKFPAADCLSTVQRELRPKYVAPVYQNARSGQQNAGANWNQYYDNDYPTRSNRTRNAAGTSDTHRDIDYPIVYKENEGIRFTPRSTLRVWSQTAQSCVDYIVGSTTTGRKVQAWVSEEAANFIRKNLNFISTIEAGYLFTQLAKENTGLDAVYYCDARKEIRITGTNDVMSRITSNAELTDDDFKGIVLAKKGAVLSIKEYEVYNGKRVSLQEYTQLVRCGCAVCNTAVLPKDAEELLWVSDNTFLCQECAENETHTNMH